MSSLRPIAWLLGVLALATGCTRVVADVSRRDVVLAGERLPLPPPGWVSEPVERVVVTTRVGPPVVHMRARARRDGDTLVLERGGVELWRGATDEVSAVELGRVAARDTRVRAEVDDAGATVLAIGGLLIGTLVVLILVEEN